MSSRKIQEVKTRVAEASGVRSLIEAEYERTGGIFRLAPCWVGRPGIIVPGRRIKLQADYMNQDVAENFKYYLQLVNEVCTYR